VRPEQCGSRVGRRSPEKTLIRFDERMQTASAALRRSESRLINFIVQVGHPVLAGKPTPKLLAGCRLAEGLTSLGKTRPLGARWHASRP